MEPSERKRRREAEKEKLHTLHGWKKLQYLLDYYKFPMVLCGILLYILVYSFYGRITHKDVVLYTSLVNVAAGEYLTQDLTRHFLESEHIDPKRNEIYLYSGLYLTEDNKNPYHEYTYASRMKILAAIDAEQMDVVFMNKEAFDAFSQNGYLCDLEKLLSAEDQKLYERLKPYLILNTYILEDNSIDLYFDDSLTYQAQTEEYLMGIDLSASPMVKKAGFTESVYLGILANSPRKAEAAAYVEYLFCI